MNFVVSLAFLFMLPLLSYSVINSNTFIQMSVGNTAGKEHNPFSTRHTYISSLHNFPIADLVFLTFVAQCFSAIPLFSRHYLAHSAVPPLASLWAWTNRADEGLPSMLVAAPPGILVFPVAASHSSSFPLSPSLPCSLPLLLTLHTPPHTCKVPWSQVQIQEPHIKHSYQMFFNLILEPPMVRGFKPSWINYSSV